MRKLFWMVGVVLCATCSINAQASFKYDFTGTSISGYTPVGPEMTYSKDRGFGFEPGSTVKIANGATTSGQPFYFSVAVPEGNYKVTIEFGDTAGATMTTVKSELRRLMLENVTTAPGKFETRSFTANVKTPAISTGGQVRLKGNREAVQEAFDWDDKLTLYFSNSHPAIRNIQIEKADVPTIFILGDSTSCDQMVEPYSSWGQSIPRFFTPDVAVANHGESGESVGASIGAHRFDKIYDSMKSGDYLLVQFGHNDMKSTAPDALAKYKEGLTNWIEKTRSKNATPILVTPVSRRTFENGKITNSFITRSGDDYVQAVKDVAKETQTVLIDLNERSKVLYETIGPEKAPLLFAKTRDNTYDGTHHGDFGSYEVAKCIVQGIIDNKLPLSKNIVSDWTTFDPAHPDAMEKFTLPPDPIPGQSQAPPGS